MDTSGKLIKLIKDKRGIATVYIALIMIALVAFVGLGIDIGYMYVAKGQLQNAADAGALAGIDELVPNGGIVVTSVSDPKVVEAKSKAVEFAAKNQAAGRGVEILYDNTSNTFTDNNDVTVGYWDGTSYTESGTPINAIKVRARRTANSPGGEVNIFFGRILSLIPGLTGWNQMGASAVATAGLPPRATAFLSFCTSACPSGPTTFPNGKAFETGADTKPDYSSSFAWTTLLTNPSSANVLSDEFICLDLPNQQVCNTSIYSTMGADASVLKDFASLFYDPNIDTSHKEITTVNIDKGKNKGTYEIVTGWTIMIPITRDCPPGQQGNAFDPKPVSKIATVHISAVCATGSETNPKGCKGYTDISDACDSSKTDQPLPAKNCCNNFSNNVIVIDSISCAECGSSTPPVGLKPVLVQ